MKSNHGRRYTQNEISKLVALWQSEVPLDDIARELSSTPHAIRRLIVRMRSDGIPLKRHRAGNVAGKRNANWTQSEVEYLLRRRKERATMEQIAVELNRTFSSIQGMSAKLKKEGVPIESLGTGRRRLWDIDAIASMVHMDNVITLIPKAA